MFETLNYDSIHEVGNIPRAELRRQMWEVRKDDNFKIIYIVYQSWISCITKVLYALWSKSLYVT